LWRRPVLFAPGTPHCPPVRREAPGLPGGHAARLHLPRRRAVRQPGGHPRQRPAAGDLPGGTEGAHRRGGVLRVAGAVPGAEGL